MKPDQLSLASIVSRGNTLASDLDGEIILLSTENNKFYGMDTVAARIWDLTAKPITVAEIVQRLRDEYKVGEDQCIQDVLAFLRNLCDEKLLCIENLSVP